MCVCVCVCVCMCVCVTVQILKDLALNGRTVILTIHQPRSSIFQMFDNIMLLSEGNPIYFGSSEDAIGCVLYSHPPPLSCVSLLLSYAFGGRR